MTLGKKLLMLRKESNKTQQEVADHIGKTRTLITQWESDERKPILNDLIALSNYYGISLLELTDEDYDVTKRINVISFLPKNIYCLRIKKGIEIDDLAEQLGYNKEAIEDLENGRKRADAYDVIKLSKIFNISTDDLLNKDLSKSEKYTKEETKEKITSIVNNSDLEEDKKNMINTMVNMVCEVKEEV